MELNILNSQMLLNREVKNFVPKNLTNVVKNLNINLTLKVPNITKTCHDCYQNHLCQNF